MSKELLADKRAHLAMIQGVVNRMGNNSFFIKGWSITATVTINGFLLKENHQHIAIVFMACITILISWYADAHFLKLERGFRNFYDEVREEELGKYNFDIKPLVKESFYKTIVRPALLVQYLTLLVITFVVLLLSYR